eukprot:6208050-Pleurochrysis_carterae.AAC.2
MHEREPVRCRAIDACTEEICTSRRRFVKLRSVCACVRLSYLQTSASRTIAGRHTLGTSAGSSVTVRVRATAQVCVRAYMCACVRECACVRPCVRAYMGACVRASVLACLRAAVPHRRAREALRPTHSLLRCSRWRGMTARSFGLARQMRMLVSSEPEKR